MKDIYLVESCPAWPTIYLVYFKSEQVGAFRITSSGFVYYGKREYEQEAYSALMDK